MPLGWTLSESGDHVNFLHFPVSGIVSLIYVLEDGSSSEIALVGNEGMVGISIFMGGESMPSSTEVQSAGRAYRLSRQIMKREFALGGQLQHLALLYTQALICQTSQTAVCNQHHTLDQQLCRWLLMSVDRLHENKLEITQEMIANLLGVRRESITQAAGRLQKEGADLLRAWPDQDREPCKAGGAGLRVLRSGQARIPAPASIGAQCHAIEGLSATRVPGKVMTCSTFHSSLRILTFAPHDLARPPAA
jgi:CRP-like cAMP-binding protein